MVPAYCKNDSDQVVFAHQVSLLYQNAPLAYAVTLVNGAILTFVLKTYIPVSDLSIWFALLSLATGARAILVYRYGRVEPPPEQITYWYWIFFIGAMIAGIIWGSTAIFLFPVESIGHQVFVALVLAGMSAGAVAAFSARFEICLVFLLPTLLPLSVRFFMQADELHIAMGMMSLIFLAGMSTTARTIYRSIADSLRLGLDNRELLAEVARRQRVEESLFQERERLQTTLFPKDGRDAEALLKKADMAMYRAKEDGRNNAKFFAQEMNVRALRHLVMEQEMRRGLTREEFTLLYQPQLALGSGRIIGVEALLRWRHPKRGLIPPKEFVPLAEETGVIVPIGEWSIRTACAQAKVWRDEGPPERLMAVNISTRQFMRKNMPEMIKGILEESGLEPGFLELEITESLLMKDVERAIDIMRQLKDMGVRVSIDDFGTGYSSLNYLKHFPVSRLKIAECFVRDITKDPDDQAIAKAVIALAHSLRLEVIAEGVETEEQLAFLKSRKCDQVQGFYVGRPINSSAMTVLLRDTAMGSSSRS